MNPGHRRRSIRIACWNVNSVRARLPLIERFVKTTNPDVLCLQETKVEDSSFPLDFFAKHGYASALLRGQRAYHGVAILSRFDLGPGETNDCRVASSSIISMFRPAAMLPTRRSTINLPTSSIFWMK